MSTTSLSKAEKSYIAAGLTQSTPHRADGRNLTDYRSVALEAGVAPLANGSVRLSIGRNINDNGGGTEVLAATKLEVESISIGESSEGREGGRFIVNVSCSPAAYPHLTQNALDDLQHDLTTILHTTLTHPSLHPQNLTILPHKKSWLLHLDLLILSDAGNTLDALFLAARAALWDTKVPRTRSVEYKAPRGSNKANAGANTTVEGGDIDVDSTAPSGFDTRTQISRATDFELPDYWDEGEALDGRDRWPVCVTLNLAPPVHFLDATPQEESAIPLRLLLIFSFTSTSKGEATLQAMRSLGAGELSLVQIKDLIQTGEKYAHSLYTALNAKLKDEDIRRTQKARERFIAARR
ncbi:ribosomal protein S5 domain 2-like protein [Macrolepiota fuliginosa MF-IS2]|uniref:Ribosomal RNA-processing protein 42 n=1 Tax=Macrolepiota fuliginosa MF-IS2 TaxID=1400762 RepID=A0A9P5XC77_9AGAR|nr:ribosomal protein S5 domain 2-like protein [Macrolepiota fuliginosa MF-IS2]